MQPDGSHASFLCVPKSLRFAGTDAYNKWNLS